MVPVQFSEEGEGSGFGVAIVHGFTLAHISPRAAHVVWLLLING